MGILATCRNRTDLWCHQRRICGTLPELNRLAEAIRRRLAATVAQLFPASRSEEVVHDLLLALFRSLRSAERTIEFELDVSDECLSDQERRRYPETTSGLIDGRFQIGR